MIVAMEDLTSDGADLDFREFEGAVGRSSSAFSSTPVPGRGVKNVIGRDSVHRTPTNVDSEEVPVVLVCMPIAIVSHNREF